MTTKKIDMKKLFFFSSNLIHLLISSRNEIASNEVHLQEGIEWLKRAQDATPNSGVSSGYHLYHGWLPSYPETTGYIIETFLDYYHLIGTMEIKQRALDMADWLVSIQFEDGAFPDTPLKQKLVFDTGQIIFGLVRIYEETEKERFKEAAIRAGDWLLTMQEDNGVWEKGAYNGIPHAYYSRVAWSLLEIHRITNEDKYVLGNEKNIEWVISNQIDNGWFNNASFTLKNHTHPFTHTIAYTIRGILESGIYLNNDRYINSAENAIKNILNQINEDGFVSGVFNREWVGMKKYSCLTGSAQLAIIYFKLAKIRNNEQYYNKACDITRYLKTKQIKNTSNYNIKGAIAGSFPVWGGYIHFALPNWATKFFCDTLVLEYSLKD